MTTLLISLFGPAIYSNYDKKIVVIYILFFLMFFSLFYFFGINSKNDKKFKTFDLDFKILPFFKLFLIVNYLILIFDYPFTIITNGFTFESLGNSYLNTYEDFERNSGKSYSLQELLRFGRGILDFVIIVLGIYYFDKLPVKWKTIFASYVIMLAFFSLIFIGKQKQVGDIFLIIFSILLVKNYKVSFSTKKVLLVFSTLLTISYLFVYIQKSRYEAVGINLYNYAQRSQQGVTLNPDHFIFKVFGEDWGFPIAMFLSGYLSGGYYGLSLTLNMAFEWTKGLGSSYVFSVLIDRLTNLPFLFESNYLFRMEDIYGWPALSKWHTIFPWLASDFTFIGAILFMCLVAYIYSISWIEAYKYRNPISVLMFCLINVMLAFVPANNQLFMGIEQYFLTNILLLIWFFRHKIFRYKVES